MENKTKKSRWTKKFKVTFITLCLAFVVALGGAFTAIGLTVSGNNGRLGGHFAGGVTDENTPAIPEAEETFSAGATINEVTYATNAEAWAAAVDYSITNNAVVQFNLTKNWIANATTGFGTATETNSPFGQHGALRVPADAKIILNISKNVKLDRNLPQTKEGALESGNVIFTAGQLYITGDGLITGANNLTSSLNETNVEFTESRGGAIRLFGAGSLTFAGGTIKNNSVEGGNGGAVFVGEGTKFLMTGGTIEGNYAYTPNHNEYKVNSTNYGRGGAIYSFKSKVTITGGVIKNNTSGAGGGALAFSYAFDGNNFEISNAVISGNKGNNGGAIYMYDGSDGSLTNVTISGNASAGLGGAIQLNTTAKLTINEGTVISKNTGKSGGGIFVSANTGSPISKLIMNGGEITNNTATENGGGVCCDTLGVFTMTGGTISNNTAGKNGGGIYSVAPGVYEEKEEGDESEAELLQAGLTITGGTIDGNTATKAGGGIYVSDATLNLGAKAEDGTLSGAAVISNNKVTDTSTSYNGGGGIAAYGESTTNIYGGTIKGNWGSRGGGIHTTNTLNVEGGIITENTAGGNGGGIMAQHLNGKEYTVTISGGEIFKNKSAVSTGGVFISAFGTLEMTGGKIHDNTAGGNGGGVNLYGTAEDDYATMNMSGGEIYNNTANGSGGGISTGRYIKLTMTGGTITGNTANSHGGGIYVYIGVTFTMSKGTISNNTANMHGGGIYTDTDATINLNGSLVNGQNSIQINNNKATNHGGGIVCNGSLTMSYVTFDGNSCGGNGGGMNVLSFIADHITVTNNTAGGNGGGALLCNNHTYTITDCTISGNTALNGNGGGIYSKGELTIKSGTISNNKACGDVNGSNYSTRRGGGIWFEGTAINLGVKTDTTNVVEIVGNSSEWSGGGMYVYSKNVTEANFNNVKFRQNRAGGDGGGYCQLTLKPETTPTFYGCEITDNYANNSGGGLYLSSGNNFVESCVFKDNTAGTVEGGGIYVLSAATAEIKKAILKDNKAGTNGGGLSVSSNSTATVTDSTISGNKALSYGGGVYNLGNARIKDSPLTGNKAVDGGGIYNTGVLELGSSLSGNEAYNNGGGVYDDGTLYVVGTSVTVKDNISAQFTNNVYFVSMKINGYSNPCPVQEIGISAKTTPFVIVNGTGRMINSEGKCFYFPDDPDNYEVVETSWLYNGTKTVYDYTLQRKNTTDSLATRWVNAVTNSGKNNPQLFELTENWTATTSGSGDTLTSSFGTNTAGKEGFKGGALHVPAGKNVVLDLTDKALDRAINIRPGGLENGSVIIVEGTLTIKGKGTIGGGFADGGGIYVAAGGKLIMNGGTIMGNMAAAGGGVLVATDGTFEMNGGAISSNSAAQGGGIWNGGTVIMNGGTIGGFNVGNGATDGGGVYNTSTFTMNGGSISYNSGGGFGGGALSGGTFTMNGGSISNNTAGAGGGGGIHASGTLNIYNGTLSGNTSNSTGGGVFAVNCNMTLGEHKTVNGKEVYSGNVYIQNSKSRGFGVGIYLCGAGSTLNMYGGVISGNYPIDENGEKVTPASTQNGGGIYADGSTELNIYGGNIRSNEAYDGGGIYSKGTLNVHGGMIGSVNSATGNKATASGGGVYIAEGTFNMDDGTIAGNTAYASSAGGGGVCIASGTTFTMDGGSICNNNSNGNVGGGVLALGTFNFNGGKIYSNISFGGSGVFIHSNGTLNMGSATVEGKGEIYNNISNTQAGSETAGFGGGVYLYGGARFNLYSGKIYNNTALNAGGVYVSSVSHNIFNMYGGTISGNTATASGGGVYCDTGSTFTMSGGTISSNSASEYGGGVYSNAAGVKNANGAITTYGLTISGGTISGNTAGKNGGGLTLESATGEIKGGNIINNTSEQHGAGVLLWINATLTMSGGEISGNNTISSGGGISIIESTFNMSGRAVISGNTAGSNGGGIYAALSIREDGPKTNTITMSGGEISGNTAGSSGGGVYADQSSTLTMSGGTITGNTAKTNGGGVFGYTGATVAISGGTISKNTAVRGGGLYIYNGTLTISGNDTEICENKTVKASDNTGGYGGGIYLNYDKNNTGDKTNVISGGSIHNNDAVGDGGMIIGNSSSYKAILKFTGGAIYSNTASAAGGLSVESGAEVQMSGTAEIYGNSATGVGGGVTIASSGGASLSGGKLVMTGGSIHNNNADGDGGGIVVASKCTLEISGTAVISGNTSSGRGGGVYVSGATSTTTNGTTTTKPAGTFTMSGGTVSGNEASRGGGVYALGTFTMSGGQIYENEAEYGAGVSAIDGGSLAISGSAKIRNNTSSGRGGGVYINSAATLTMSGGEIFGNTADIRGGGLFINGDSNNSTYASATISGTAAIYENTAADLGGGVYIAVNGTLKMTGGSITENEAGENGGGVYVAGAMEVSGNVNITENTLEDGKTANNVYLVADKKITVAGTLANTARIGVSAEGGAGTVITSGFSGSMHPGVVFSADDKHLTVGKSGNEAAFVACNNINFTVYDKDGNETETTAFIKVDAGTAVTYTLSADKSELTFKSTQGSRTNVETVVSVPVVAGYTPYVYNPDDGDAEVLSGAGVLANVSADRDLRIGYRADEDTEYTVFYILQQANVTTNNGYVTATSPSELRGLSSVKEYTGHGTTDKPLKYLTDDNKPLADWDEKQHYTYDSKNISNPIVGGDGDTVLLVYLKLNEYTVTYSSAGASPTTQSKKIKYKGVITEPARKPSKTLSDFLGWTYTNCTCEWTSCEHKVNFGTDKVTGDVTVYAKFSVKHYTITFDLNISDYDDNALPENNDLSIPMNGDDKLANGLVAWKHEDLFPDENGFAWSEIGKGVYTIDYTIDNVPQAMSIKNVKPSAIGYVFDGWFLEGSESTTATTTIKKPTSSTAKNMRLVAHWSPASYTLHLDKRDGSFNQVTEHRVKHRTLLSEIAVLQEDKYPERGGYTFAGWYITDGTEENLKRHVTIEENCYEDEDSGDLYFSIAKFADLAVYGNAVDGYNFSNLTLYAEWESNPVYIVYDSAETGKLTFKDSDGETITISEDTVKIGDEITVVPTPAPGYKFVSITVAGDELDEGVKTFIIRGTYVVDDEVVVSGKFVEDTYKITYSSNGGTSSGSVGAAHTYTKSQLEAGSVKLSSNIKRLGYNFRGWKFEGGGTAFTTTSTKADLRGEDLRLKAYTNSSDGKVEYRDVKLVAVWEAQSAQVNLYKANYVEIIPGYVGDNETGYKIPNLKTAQKIDIINPTRPSFDFLGWATSKNGTVVYPVSEDKDVTTIEYTVNADKDENGNALNQNNLYAVWHVKGVDRILMSVEGNDSVYGGAGVTMSAKPAQSYDDGSGNTITLMYKWYRIYDGMYDDCFTSGYVYVNNGTVTGYKFGDVYSSDVEGKKVLTSQPAGEELEYRRFEESKVGESCELKFETPKPLTPSQTSTLNIKHVNDCGTYVCVVEVTATDEDKSTTRAGGYGEIEISMRKAEYTDLTLSDVQREYNTKVQWRALRLESSDLDETSEDGVIYLNLPDYKYDKVTGLKIANTNSRVIVTYKYYVGLGTARREITDLNEIKNAGTYYVVVSFAFAMNGDKGNYEEFESMEAELVITKHTISNIEYALVHGETKNTTNFTGPYDGVAYSVEATIKDNIGAGSGTYAGTDDVALKLSVYEIVDDSEVLYEGETVDAGRYSVRITGIEGADKDNYELPKGTLRKEYTIGKSVYDVSGHITFADKEVEFDDELHSIEIEIAETYELPSTVKVKYSRVYEPEEPSFTNNHHQEDNFNEKGNAGRYAGVYTVTVRFEDSAAENYAEIPSMTATLTIKQAKLLSHFANGHGEDLLASGGFTNSTFAFNAEVAGYLPVISGGRLSDEDDFDIDYEYYEVNDTTGARRALNVDGGEKIKEAGRYEIVANIRYVSAFYMNNFEEVEASESTITYVIRNVDVESVAVIFDSGFVAGGKVAKLNEGFNYEWIDEITVNYLDKDTNTRSVRHITGDDVKLALITLENGQTTFWHVGSFDFKVTVYEFDSDAYQVNVKQEISEVQVQSSKNGGVYLPVGEDGIEYEADATYGFRVAFTGVTVNGAEGNVQVDVEAKSALTLGANALQASASDDLSAYYILPEDLSVNFYKVINSDVTWQYSTNSTDGVDGTWANVPQDENDVYKLPYIGKEYMIRVTFEDNGTKSCLAKTTNGVAVRNYNANGYDIEVGRSGNYKIDATTIIDVEKRVLTVSWGGDNWNASTNSFVYNGWHQSPTVVSDNVVEADRSAITYEYQLESESGSILSQSDVIEVGKYVIKVILGGESEVVGNYVVNYNSETSKTKLTYGIEQATIEMTPIYSEHTYGPNVTYAGNTHGLRQDALKADFGEKAEVKGRFAFIANYDAATGEFDEVDGKTLVSKIAAAGTANVDYAYIPEDGNYKTKIGKIALTVKSQVAKSGSGALSVEFGEHSVRFYIINQRFDDEDITVYRLYESAYKEDGVWYGYRGENPLYVGGSEEYKDAKLRINGIVANGYLITSTDLTSKKIVLLARAGSNEGTLEIPVIDKLAKELKIISTEHRTVFYVGEKYDFSDMEFRVILEDDSYQDGLKQGSVKSDFDGKTFETAGTQKITFTYFNKECELTVTVQGKEDLTVVRPTDVVLTWTGEKLEAPELTFLDKDSKPVTEGISVEVAVQQNNRPATLKDEGTYSVQYAITVTNPRFNKITKAVIIEVKVTKNPYKVEIIVPKGEELTAAYTGTAIAIPKPTVGDVTDSTNNNEKVTSRVHYEVAGVEIGLEDDGWKKLHAGDYKVEITVEAYKNGEWKEAATAEYTFVITKATNGNLVVTTSPVVLGDGANFKFPVTADFGAETVTYKYSTERNGQYSDAVPTEAGVWFVKATIAGTDDYTGLEVIERFNVRANSVDAGDKGSISGGDGIGKNWKLEITEADVSGESVSKQNVHEGYNVILKNEDDAPVTADKAYTVRVKLSDALANRKDLKVYYKDNSTGKTVEKKAVVKDGYIEFQTKDFGTFIITSAVAGAPVGLIVGVSLCAVVAAAMIAACIIVFLKKRKRGAQ